jgi:hypothetical protein
MKREFSRRIFEKSSVSNLISIRPVGVELFHADRQTDGRTDITKLIVAFRNFAQSPKIHLRAGNQALKGKG